MNQISAIISSVSVLGIFMAIGFISVKSGYVKKEATSFLSHIVTRLVFPIWIMSKLLSNEVTLQQLFDRLPLFISGLVFTQSTMLLAVLITKLLKMEDKRKYVFVAITYSVNSIFMGVPICQELFGDSGALSCTILALGSNIITWTTGISYISAGASKISGIKKEKGKFSVNPIMVTYVLCLVLKFCGVNLPSLLIGPFTKLGSALSYLAMMYLGMSLTNLKLKNIFKHKLIYLYIPLKLFIIPLIVNVIAKISGFFSPEYLGVLTVVYAASPSISLTMFYKEYNLDYDFGNLMTFICVLLNIVTIPFMYWICGRINF
ncbi:MAG: AEC family transporter [Clostridia bacterium]|nr:AEC family transporter [Clostridia bacterium]